MITKMEMLRRNKNYTQKELARLCNLHQPMVSLIESREVRPPLITLQSIAKVLDYEDDPRNLLKDISHDN
jgi:transcriptional regulator with XRE-family HTH domain